jgi:Flp pilus assembly protein TadG
MKHLFSSNHGSALVELAVALPIIMFIMTGIFTFSVALNQKLVLTEAISAGGRFLAADVGDTNPCSATTAVIHAAAPNLSNSSLTLTYTLNGVQSGTSCPGSTTNSSTVNTNLASGKNAQIRATYPCNISVYGVSFGACTLNASIQEVVQ